MQIYEFVYISRRIHSYELITTAPPKLCRKEVFRLGMATWNILNESDFLFPLHVTKVRAQKGISSQILKLLNYGMVTSLRLKPHFFHGNARTRRKELGDHSNWKSCNFRAIFSLCRQTLSYVGRKLQNQKHKYAQSFIRSGLNTVF